MQNLVAALHVYERAQGYLAVQDDKIVNVPLKPNFLDRYWLYQRIIDIISRTLITQLDSNTPHVRDLYDYFKRHDADAIYEITGLQRDGVIKALRPWIQWVDACNANLENFNHFWEWRRRNPNAATYEVFKHLEVEGPAPVSPPNIMVDLDGLLGDLDK